MRKLLCLAAVVSFALGETMASAFAENYIVHFHGTRAQVRSACARGGDTASEGGNYTSCISGNTGNSVTCDSKGNCTGTYTAAKANGGGHTGPKANPASIGAVLAP
jgi:hypothetical protein